MKITPTPAISLMLCCVFLPGCETAEGHPEERRAEGQTGEGELGQTRTILVTSPVQKDVVLTQEYVCQIHSRQHIEVCALDEGYLEEIHIKEGQAVKQDDLMFKIFPVLYKAELATVKAEAQQAQIEYNNTKTLFEKSVVSNQALALVEARLNKANAQVELAQAKLGFTEVKAPFSGIVDRQFHQQGSLIEEAEILTTLSDNDVMWVYFNVPEARYLEYMATPGARDPQHPQQLKLPNAQIELRLADGSVFNQTAGDVVTVEGNFDNETGNIAFRADFPNPDHLLRHGQTGTILIHRTLHNAIVIPQRATYEVLDKQYVYVVEGSEDAAEHGSQPTGEQEHPQASAPGSGPVAEHDAEPGQERARVRGVAHRRHIVIEHEMDDVFIIKSGLGPDDKIVLDGVRQVHDGGETDYELEKPEEVFSNLKFYAE